MKAEHIALIVWAVMIVVMFVFEYFAYRSAIKKKEKEQQGIVDAERKNDQADFAENLRGEK